MRDQTYLTMRDSKINPAPIVAGFIRTLVDDEGKPSRRDQLEQYVLPLLCGLLAGINHVRLSEAIAIAILTLASIFAAFLFQLTIQLLDRAATWADQRPPPGPSTSEHADLLEELSANAGYASMVSGITGVAALVSTVPMNRWLEVAVSTATIVLLAHLGTALLLVIRRVFLLTKSRLNAARVSGVTHRKSA